MALQKLLDFASIRTNEQIQDDIARYISNSIKNETLKSKQQNETNIWEKYCDEYSDSKNPPTEERKIYLDNIIQELELSLRQLCEEIWELDNLLEEEIGWNFNNLPRSKLNMYSQIEQNEHSKINTIYGIQQFTMIDPNTNVEYHVTYCNFCEYYSIGDVLENHLDDHSYKCPISNY